MATLSAAHFLDSDITETASGSDDWASTSPNAQERTTAYPQDRAHLNGQTVQILDDGVVVATQVVSSGVVSGISGTYHIGLQFNSTLKPTKLDIEGLGLSLTKKITRAVLSFYNTLRGKYGVSTSTLFDVAPDDTDLFTGIKEVNMPSGYEREGDIVISQQEPLPLTARAMFLDIGVYDR